jgi:hypothetical protein
LLKVKVLRSAAHTRIPQVHSNETQRRCLATVRESPLTVSCTLKAAASISLVPLDSLLYTLTTTDVALRRQAVAACTYRFGQRDTVSDFTIMDQHLGLQYRIEAGT